jgi:hypothetical protein
MNSGVSLKERQEPRSFHEVDFLSKRRSEWMTPKMILLEVRKSS